MNLPLYTSVSRSSLSDLGRSAYQAFDKAIVLTQVIRQQGQDPDPEQIRIREVLLHLRDAKVTQADWERLMERRIEHVANKDTFNQALHLLPTVNAVAEHNLEKLRQNSQPVAEIKAVHSGSKDFCTGLTFVACSRVRSITDLMFNPGFDFDRVSKRELKPRACGPTCYPSTSYGNYGDCSVMHCRSRV